MTHFKSTLATAFVALSGLVVAQQVLYPRVDEPPRPRVVIAETAAIAAPTTTWSDPPAKAQAPAAVAEAQTADPKPEDAQAAEVEAPAQAVPVPPTRHVALGSDGSKKAEAGKRRKPAQTAARNRQVASRAPVAAETAAPTSAAPQPRVDPIGDILRGLGIGRQG